MCLLSLRQTPANRLIAGLGWIGRSLVWGTVGNGRWLRLMGGGVRQILVSIKSLEATTGVTRDVQGVTMLRETTRHVGGGRNGRAFLVSRAGVHRGIVGSRNSALAVN